MSKDYTLHLNTAPKVLGASKVLGEIQTSARVDAESTASGETSDIDVDQDGRPDIRVTLKSLTATHAEINFVSLSAAGSAHLLSMLGVGG